MTPTKATVDQAWQRYAALQSAIHADPHARNDPSLLLGAMRAHERFCKLYNEWCGR